MKTTKLILIIWMTLLSIQTAFAGNFTSINSGYWSLPQTWSYSNDSDGIPDANDSVTISASNTVNFSGNIFCSFIHIQNSAKLNGLSSTGKLTVLDFFMNEGELKGKGMIVFNGNGAVLSGAGIFSNLYSWKFNTNTVLDTTVHLTCLSNFYIENGATVTNQGTLILKSVSCIGAMKGYLKNLSGGKLYLRSGSMNAHLDAEDTGNLVCIQFNYGNGFIPNPVNGVFDNLAILPSNYFVGLKNDLVVNGKFTVSNGAEFRTGGKNINFRGDFTNRGIFFCSPLSQVIFDGTQTQLITSEVDSTQFSDLIINNNTGVIVQDFGKFYIKKSLTVDGFFDTGKNSVILLSDSVSTACIKPSNGSIAGTMTVQRYISNRADGYSDISSPVLNPDFTQWQDDLDLAFVPYIPGLMSPSCWAYNESNFNYLPIESEYEILEPGMGYQMYLASDGDSSTPFISTTVDIIGTANMGDISVFVTNQNDGWNLIGNPYASFIDWDHFRTNAGIPFGLEFQYYDETIQDFKIGYPGEQIAPGQGFWIQALSSGNVVFHESNKVVSNSSDYRIELSNEISLNVSVPGQDSKFKLYFTFNSSPDENMILIKQNVDSDLHVFAYSDEGRKLKRKSISSNMNIEIPVGLNVSQSGTFVISFSGLESILGLGYEKVILFDSKTGIKHDLFESEYSFSAQKGESENRFTLFFSGHEDDHIAVEDLKILQKADRFTLINDRDDNIEANIRFYSLSGQEIANVPTILNTGSTDVSIPLLETGIYFMEVVYGEQRKVIKFCK